MNQQKMAVQPLEPVRVPDGVVCFFCGNGFDTSNSERVRMTSLKEPLHTTAGGLHPELVGKTLKEAATEIDRLQGNRCHHVPLLKIQNDKWATPDWLKAPMELKQMFNVMVPPEERGWRDSNSTDVKIDENYILAPGDKTLMERMTYFHNNCYRQWTSGNRKIIISNMLGQAGFMEVELLEEEIPECIIERRMEACGETRAQVLELLEREAAACFSLDTEHFQGAHILGLEKEAVLYWSPTDEELTKFCSLIGNNATRLCGKYVPISFDPEFLACLHAVFEPEIDDSDQNNPDDGEDPDDQKNGTPHGLIQ